LRRSSRYSPTRLRSWAAAFEQFDESFRMFLAAPIGLPVFRRKPVSRCIAFPYPMLTAMKLHQFTARLHLWLLAGVWAGAGVCRRSPASLWVGGSAGIGHSSCPLSHAIGRQELLKLF